jgi:hypothetical protein
VVKPTTKWGLKQVALPIFIALGADPYSQPLEESSDDEDGDEESDSSETVRRRFSCIHRPLKPRVV